MTGRQHTGSGFPIGLMLLPLVLLSCKATPAEPGPHDQTGWRDLGLCVADVLLADIEYASGDLFLADGVNGIWRQSPAITGAWESMPFSFALQDSGFDNGVHGIAVSNDHVFTAVFGKEPGSSGVYELKTYPLGPFTSWERIAGPVPLSIAAVPGALFATNLFGVFQYSLTSAAWDTLLFRPLPNPLFNDSKVAAYGCDVVAWGLVFPHTGVGRIYRLSCNDPTLREIASCGPLGSTYPWAVAPLGDDAYVEAVFYSLMRGGHDGCLAITETRHPQVAFQVSADDQDFVLGAADSLHWTTDGGSTWSSVQPFEDESFYMYPMLIQWDTRVVYAVLWDTPTHGSLRCADLDYLLSLKGREQ